MQIDLILIDAFTLDIKLIRINLLHNSCVDYDSWLRNEFHFSEVYRSVNYIGSRAKWMNPEGVHVNLASDPM